MLMDIRPGVCEYRPDADEGHPQVDCDEQNPDKGGARPENAVCDFRITKGIRDIPLHWSSACRAIAQTLDY